MKKQTASAVETPFIVFVLIMLAVLSFIFRPDL
jgi:hypothetical protein